MDARAAARLKIMVVGDNADAAAMLAMLLDVGLPDIDGNELARILRAQPETSDVVLIALTGYGLGTDREQTSAAGFDHHLVKPDDTGQLSRILADIRPPKSPPAG